MTECEQRCKVLEEIQEHDELLRNFLDNRKDTLNRLIAELWPLEPEDRKRVIEGMSFGKIALEEMQARRETAWIMRDT